MSVAVAGNVDEAVEMCRARPTVYFLIDLGMEIEIGPAVIKVMAASGTNQEGTNSGRQVNSISVESR